MLNNKYGFLSNNVIDLKLTFKTGGYGNVLPNYYYKIYLHNTDKHIGNCGIRVGESISNYYSGNIEYEIFTAYRGNNFSYQATELLKYIASDHGMKKIVITCNKDNIISNKIIKKAGGKFIEYASLPPNHKLYRFGIRNVNVYQVDLERGKSK